MADFDNSGGNEGQLRNNRRLGIQGRSNTFIRDSRVSFGTPSGYRGNAGQLKKTLESSLFEGLRSLGRE